MQDAKQMNIATGLTAQLVKPLEKIYDKVVALAKEKPWVTGDYNLLTAYYCWTYHRRYFGVKEFSDLLELPSPESITRAFRKAVENGDIIPSGKVLLRRIQREQAIRKTIHNLG